MTERLPIERTRKGFPAAWEEGGSRTSTGFSIIIADPEGKYKRPLLVRRGESRSKHALFVIRKGDVVVFAKQRREEFAINVCKVIKFGTDRYGEHAIFTPIAAFSKGEWDNEDAAAKYADAIQAAVDKATCYHCREPHYCQEVDMSPVVRTIS